MGKRIHVGSRGWLGLALVVSLMAFVGIIAPRGDARAQDFGGVSRKVVAGDLSSESPSTAGKRPAFQARHKLGDLLRPDGTLDPRSGFRGAIDAQGYRLVSNAGEAPRFEAVSSPVPGDERWADLFGLGIGVADSGRTDCPVQAMLLDGNGDLYVGGSFRAVSGSAANAIAKWDGASWSALGSGISDGDVYALAVDGSGNLYAGGCFTTAGGVPANAIAKWDGTGWSALGSGIIDGCVNALAVDASGNLYAGGSFTTAGSVPANYIAKWDGTTWSALGSGMDEYGFVNALVVDGSGNLYAGGYFTTAGGVPANAIAKWDGTSWSVLGTGISNGYLFALAVDGSGNLYAGGYFTSAGGGPANSIYKWDGRSWSTLGSGIVEASVNALVVDGYGNLYAGGWFSMAGGVAAHRIAKWDGTAWSAVGRGTEDDLDSTALVYALAVDGNGTPYAGGRFTTAGGVWVNNIAKWDAGRWWGMGTESGEGVDSISWGLVCYRNDSLYTVRGFKTVGGDWANYIAKWDGTAWSAPGGNIIEGSLMSLAVDGNGNLYAGGYFTKIGGVSASKIVKWDGTSWSALGSGIGNGSVSALAVDGSGNLYAGGWFSVAGGVPAKSIAKWDGTAWSALGTGIASGNDDGNDNGSVFALVADGSGNLYAGGDFTKAGGVRAKSIAKWDGTVWSALGSGISDGDVKALAVDGSGNLYAGGWFSMVGSVAAHRIAKWDGTAWSALGSGMGINGDFVFALAVDGSDNLYAGGKFSEAGGVPANHIAKWDGIAWSALGSGMDNSVSYLAVNRPEGVLYAGGAFVTAGGKPSIHIAQWGAILPPAPTITTLTPASGPAGTAVTITGTNFGASKGSSTVKFNGVPATNYTSWSDTRIKCSVPAGATTGAVRVTTSEGTSNGIGFTVIPAPALTSLSPTAGLVGTSVTLAGANFGASQGSSAVKFKGVPATSYTSWSDTQIKCNVPAGATTGAVKVTTAGGTSNGIGFTVISAPAITSLSPTAGRVGTVVTLTGANFGASQGSSVVRLNGVAATNYTSWSDTRIRCKVPARATTGAVKVTTAGGTSNGIVFTVIPAPAITSLSPTSGRIGTVVTITGANFGASRGSSSVKFKRVPATSYTSWSDTQIKCKVPAGATTGAVKITTTGGTSKGIVFTVTPSITSQSPTSGAVGTLGRP